MTLPDIDTLTTYGGGLNDFSPVVDPTTDRPAAGANAAYASLAAMTATAPRAWVRMTLNGASAPTLVAHNSHWGNQIGVAPVLSRSSAGVLVVTWPTTVTDQILPGSPGYFGPHTLNLRAGWGNVRFVSTAWLVFVIPSTNVATVNICSVAGTLSDTTATDVDVYVI
jgi:hypothetical protein